MKFKVKITESTSQVFEIEAEDEGKALDVAYDKLYNGEIFFDPCYAEVEMEIVDNDE